MSHPCPTCRGGSSAPRISHVVFTAAGPSDRTRGLVGFVRFLLDEHLVVDGVTVRRTLANEYRLSWPKRSDSGGRQHFVLRPAGDPERLELERQILGAISLGSASDSDREEARP